VGYYGLVQVFEPWGKVEQGEFLFWVGWERVLICDSKVEDGYYGWH